MDIRTREYQQVEQFKIKFKKKNMFIQTKALIFLAGTFAGIAGVPVSEDSFTCPSGYKYNPQVKKIITKKILIFS